MALKRKQTGKGKGQKGKGQKRQNSPKNKPALAKKKPKPNPPTLQIKKQSPSASSVTSSTQATFRAALIKQRGELCCITGAAEVLAAHIWPKCEAAEYSNKHNSSLGVTAIGGLICQHKFWCLGNCLAQCLAVFG
eukprot:TRINITY_DN66774_c5_g7_i1.p1 TRINITY_DN66774_c5_g7~~TRINITY_DN66774_c5_g7_i1.p1  ORF type:complete len:135 (+),score=16.11 TRINITY_DN66774_c5_g7_i1:27-431(+)